MMKKTFLLSALAMISILVGCKEKGGNDEVVSISVNPATMNFASEAGSKSMEVMSSGQWTATASADWVTLSAFEGNGKTSVNVSVEENNAEEGRTAEVVFATADRSAKLTVSQVAQGEVANQLTVEVVSTSFNSVVGNVSTNGYDGTWYIGVCPYEQFEASSEDKGFEGDAQAMAEQFMYEEVNTYKTDLSKVDGQWVFQGDYNEINLIAGWKNVSDTEYAICMFGMNASGEILTDVTLLRESTAQVEVTDFTLECTLDNITSNSFEYAIDASDEQTYYVFSFFMHDDVAELLQEGVNPDYLFNEVMADNTSDNSISVMQGDMIEDEDGNPFVIGNIPSSSEVVFVGFGLRVNAAGTQIEGRCTDAMVEMCETAAAAAPALWSSVEGVREVSQVVIPQSVKYPAAVKNIVRSINLER